MVMPFMQDEVFPLIVVMRIQHPWVSLYFDGGNLVVEPMFTQAGDGLMEMFAVTLEVAVFEHSDAHADLEDQLWFVHSCYVH